MNVVWFGFTALTSLALAPLLALWRIVCRRYINQVRVFKWAPISTDEFYKQILKCAQHKNILPGASLPRANTTVLGSGTRPAKRKAMVVVSSYDEYSEKLRELYHEHGGVAAGEAVSVFQPTHLGEQCFGDWQHNLNALAEMVLLSSGDVVVTTGGGCRMGTGGLNSEYLGLVWMLSDLPQSTCVGVDLDEI